MSSISSCTGSRFTSGEVLLRLDRLRELREFRRVVEVRRGEDDEGILVVPSEVGRAATFRVEKDEVFLLDHVDRSARAVLFVARSASSDGGVGDDDGQAFAPDDAARPRARRYGFLLRRHRGWLFVVEEIEAVHRFGRRD